MAWFSPFDLIFFQGVTLTDLQEAEKTIGRSRPTWPREEDKEEKEKQDKEKQEEKKETETREDDYRSRYRSFEEVRGNSFLFPVKENCAVCGIQSLQSFFFLSQVFLFFSLSSRSTGAAPWPLPPRPPPPCLPPCLAAPLLFTAPPLWTGPTAWAVSLPPTGLHATLREVQHSNNLMK